MEFILVCETFNLILIPKFKFRDTYLPTLLTGRGSKYYVRVPKAKKQ